MIMNKIKKNKILFLDIDDTLLRSKNIYIYLIDNNGNRKKLTPQDYTKLTLTDLKSKIDFSEFDDPVKIKESIINGRPIYENLKKIDEYVKDGWELGILTARGEEKVIKEVISEWLKNKLKNKYKLKEKNIYAVGDRKLKYDGKNSSFRKVNVLKKYLKKYKRVCLIDDSDRTINLIKEINEKDKLQIEYIHVKYK